MTTVSYGDDRRAGIPGRWQRLAGDREAFLASALIAAFVALALYCVDRGTPHADEVMYAETSANIAAGKGAVAWTHANVVPGTANALTYVPFVYAEALWIRTFGLSRVVVESFGILVIAAATWLFWAFLRRSQLVHGPISRLFLTASLPMVPSVMTLWGTNRYDVIAVFGCALAAWATSRRASRSRLALIGLAGILVGADGFHPAIIVPGLAGVAWLWGGRKDTGALIAFLAGVASGLALTFGEMYASGTLGVFRTLMVHNSVGVRSLSTVLAGPLVGHSNFRDNALTMLALGIAAASASIRTRTPQRSPAAFVGMAAGVIVPMTLTFVGRYNHTYSWLAVLPAFLLAVMAAEGRGVGRLARWAIYSLLALDALSGLPTRVGMVALEADRNSYEAPSAYIREVLEADDVVYASYIAYYPVKAVAAESFFGGAIDSMTSGQLASVSKAVLKDDSIPRAMFELPQAEVLARLGGEWAEVGHFRVARGEWRMMLPRPPKESAIFDFKVFRRKP
jgi:hypothetical protein